MRVRDDLQEMQERDDAEDLRRGQAKYRRREALFRRELAETGVQLTREDFDRE